jgi:hypothetical protein
MDLPDKSLVGKHASIYGGRRYYDEYTRALNKSFWVYSIFGAKAIAIARGDQKTLARFIQTDISDENLRKPAEKLLEDLVKAAAKSGKWTAVEQELIFENGAWTLPGLGSVGVRGLAYEAELNGRTFLVPSARYALRCKEIAGSF